MAKSQSVGGRPRKEFNKREFEKLCGLQCTLTEIATFMDLSEDTIERRCLEIYGLGFAETFAQKRTIGFVSLRRSQFKFAVTNPAMSIWLGKQYLSQREPEKFTPLELDAAIERQLASLGLSPVGDSSETPGFPTIG